MPLLNDLSPEHYEHYETLANARYDQGYTRPEADASALHDILEAEGLEEESGAPRLRPYQAEAVEDFERYSTPLRHVLAQWLAAVAALE